MERFLRAVFFLIIIGVGLYYTYPTNMDLPGYIKSFYTTLILTVLGISIGLVVGVSISFLRLAGNRVLNFIIDEYVDIIRGTPLVLQLMIFAFIILSTWRDNFYAAVIALGLNSSAYISEIIRSGINSIDKGQMEAGRAMGLSFYVTMKEVVFPQAMRNVLPALINEFIALFKETSVVGFVSVVDLTMKSKELQSITYDPTPLVFTGLVYYTSVKILSILAKLLEQRLARYDNS